MLTSLKGRERTRDEKEHEVCMCVCVSECMYCIVWVGEARDGWLDGQVKLERHGFKGGWGREYKSVGERREGRVRYL